MNGILIHISGMVQGVGFRPWVWKTATRLGLTGTVRNNFDGVRIELFGDPTAFFQSLENDPPPQARIDSVQTSGIDCQTLENFQILERESTGEALLQILPDIAIFDDCRRELFDPADRRFRYPFINCVNCGPRFSIIENLPYDRPQTSMRAFEMCAACEAEYTDPANSRYHAQPIACPNCGPQMEPENWAFIWKESMERGKIVAVKGVGGFHLACDALNPDAVSKLRKRKAKPFALMVPNLEWIKTVCAVSPAEEMLLLSRERPIVLLKLTGEFQTLEKIAPGLNALGVMLPYSPMHEIMFDLFPHPVVMTSANYSVEPMIHTNEAARRKLDGSADVFLMHDRDIVNRCDDSVCTEQGVMRPGRGVAPVSTPIESDKCILAFGADMKNTFALSHHGQMTLHPYIGDLENNVSERQWNCVGTNHGGSKSMGIEIERKFLVKDDSWRSVADEGLFCKQGYLVAEAVKTVRVRVMGDAAFLTIKGATTGISRAEFEYPIPVADAELMLGLCGAVVEKVRHLIQHEGMTWELDVFAGANAGLVMAEIELESENISIDLPDWAGEEVSFDPRYYNAWLAKYPFAEWGS